MQKNICYYVFFYKDYCKYMYIMQIHKPEYL